MNALRKILWFSAALFLAAGLGHQVVAVWRLAARADARGTALVVTITGEYAGHEGRRTFLARSALGDLVLETHDALVLGGEYRLRVLPRADIGDSPELRLLAWRRGVRAKPEKPGAQFDAPIRRIELFDKFTVYLWGYVPEGPAPKLPAYPRDGSTAWIFDAETPAQIIRSNLPAWCWVVLAAGAWVVRFALAQSRLGPWSDVSRADREGWLHPALRRIEAGPADAPARPLRLVPKPCAPWPERREHTTPLVLRRASART